ncbi:Trp biosynthesis-associated membrane protein [Cellulomonas sp. SG140]|uniref:Trp biosynthesis-associated membrane protein n=1 Tax=Cellulomonas sp. SG140 TaxID=2976536 RepID=UPI0021E95216|nr:Trp biosynthesis-associated membrane protein [Cellulomonas sp. SG140]
MVALLLLAVLVWVAAVPTWVSAAGTSVLTGTVQVHVPGTRAAPGMVGAALALAAAGAALALAGRLGRWVVMAVVLLCGVVVAWSAVALLADPGPVARQAVAAATGVDHLVGTPRTTAAPWVATLVAAIVVVCGIALGRASARWSGTSGRHEPAPARAATQRELGPMPPGAAAVVPQSQEPTAAPTVAGAPERVLPPSQAEPGRRSDAPGERSHEPDERADWDALTRGEDPT